MKKPRRPIKRQTERVVAKLLRIGASPAIDALEQLQARVMKKPRRPTKRQTERLVRRPTKRQTERLVAKLLRIGANGHAIRALERLQARADLIIAMPMAKVLEKLPIATAAGRARLLGITRQAYYDWINERTRPNPTQAAKLAELTGLSVKEIRGKE